MSPPEKQLELELAPQPRETRLALARRRASGIPARALALLSRTANAAPVWLPLIFLLHVIGLGLVPSLLESMRLDREEQRMEQRIGALEEERAALVEDLEKLSDPIYRARVRRSLVDPSGPELTLERSRVSQPPVKRS